MLPFLLVQRRDVLVFQLGELPSDIVPIPHEHTHPHFGGVLRHVAIVRPAVIIDREHDVQPLQTCRSQLATITEGLFLLRYALCCEQLRIRIVNVLHVDSAAVVPIKSVVRMVESLTHSAISIDRYCVLRL